MPAPTSPAQATFPISPPLAKMPIGTPDPNQPNNILPTLQFLKAYQQLWAAVGGTGGTGGLIVSSPWTPVLAGKTVAGAQTYSAQWGRYVSAGALVIAMFHVKLATFDAGTSGAMEIAGLPVAANADTAAIQPAFIGSWGGIALLPAYSALAGRIASGSKTIDLWQSGNGTYAQQHGAQAVTNTQFAANTEIIGGAVFIM